MISGEIVLATCIKHPYLDESSVMKIQVDCMGCLWIRAIGSMKHDINALIIHGQKEA